jgi:predicted RNA-binding Zn ribbon-like protein
MAQVLLTQEVREPFFVGDHPLLDFMNTVAVVEGQAVDFLQTDEDVVRWLQRAGLAGEGRVPKFSGSALLQAARALRESVRGLVVKRKAGLRGDVRDFNAFLAKTGSHPQLVWDGEGSLRIVRARGERTPEQMLAPLAEAAAELLATGEFELIRKCEDDGCRLWFYDRTKSHRRRWCAMAACGNRNKVKAFRLRQREV